MAARGKKICLVVPVGRHKRGMSEDNNRRP